MSNPHIGGKAGASDFQYGKPHASENASGGSGFDYLVGPSGSSANYNSVQAAVDAAELTGIGQVIGILPGIYTENVTIANNNISLYGFSTVSDDNPIDASITRIAGNITYTGLVEQYVSISNLLISGQLRIEGNEAVILWMNESRVSSNGTTTVFLPNTDGVSRIIANHCDFVEVGGSNEVFISGGAVSLFLTNCQILTNDGSLGTVTAIQTSAGGDGINLTNCFVNGRILKTGGTAGATLRGAATVIQVASGSCINRTGGSGTFFLLNTNFFSGDSGAISGGGAASNFVQGIALQFGTLLDDNNVTKIPLAGDFEYVATTPADWDTSTPTTINDAIDRLAAAYASSHVPVP